MYFNVPRGFEELVPYLRREPELRAKLFSRVGMLFYAGAGLSQPVWDAMDELAVQACGERILWVTGLGATETAPSVTFTRGDGVRSGMIGLPVPGVEVKLAPDGDKVEMRVRGPSVTPGYWRQPELTRAAFDEEGFYRLGDAVAWVDAARPAQGPRLRRARRRGFQARDRHLGERRPLAREAHRRRRAVRPGRRPHRAQPRLDRRARLPAARRVPRARAGGSPAKAPASEVLAHPAVRAKFQALLDSFAREATGSSTRIARAILLEAPPSIDASEITDKGSINQRAVLKNRAALVEALYADAASPRIIAAAKESR